MRSTLSPGIGTTSFMLYQIEKLCEAAVIIDSQNPHTSRPIIGHIGEASLRIYTHMGRSTVPDRLLIDKCEHSRLPVYPVGGDGAVICIFGEGISADRIEKSAGRMDGLEIRSSAVTDGLKLRQFHLLSVQLKNVQPFTAAQIKCTHIKILFRVCCF